MSDELVVVHVPEHDGATGYQRPAEPSDVVAWLLEQGAERHDDVQLQFVVRGQVIYTRQAGTYIVWKVE